MKNELCAYCGQGEGVHHLACPQHKEPGTSRDEAMHTWKRGWKEGDEGLESSSENPTHTLGHTIGMTGSIRDVR